jgi:hypothetical protein
MKAVFRVSNRLRAGAPIPRDFLPIPGIEHLGLCFQQKIITDPAEFNATLALIDDPRFPRRGAVISAYILTPADEAKLTAKPVVIAPVVEVSEPEPELVEEIAPVEESAPVVSESPFRMEGKAIFLGADRVAGLFGEGDKQHLRVAAEHADLRPELEAWLKSQPTI